MGITIANESILKSMKKMLNIHENIDHFDQDIIININSTFMALNQLGVGTENSFYIEDDTATWGDFLGDSSEYAGAKTLVYLKVRLLFDPPTNAFLVDAIDRQISELEWRLIAQKELRRPENG